MNIPSYKDAIRELNKKLSPKCPHGLEMLPKLLSHTFVNFGPGGAHFGQCPGCYHYLAFIFFGERLRLTVVDLTPNLPETTPDLCCRG